MKTNKAEMTQRISPGCTLFSVFYRRPLLTQAISWISGIGVLSGGLVWAQTDPNPDTFVAPTVEAPRTVKSQPVIEREPEPTFIRNRSVPKPERAAVVVHTKRRVKPNRERVFQQRLVSEPERTTIVSRKRSIVEPEREYTAVIPKKPVLSAPKLSLPTISEEVNYPSNISSESGREDYIGRTIIKSTRIQQSAQAFPERDNNAYIDSTNYNIGATRSYDTPATVVLSERSTGCKRILRSGQGLSGGICGSVARNREGNREGNVRSTRLASLSPQPSLANRRRSLARNINTVRVASASVITNSVGVSNRRYIPTVVTKSSVASNPINYLIGAFQQAINPNYSAAIPNYSNGNSSFIFPLSVPASITSVFGWRIHPISGTRRFHAGTDLGAPMGTPVLAASAGKVEVADWMGGYGLAVIVQHNQSQETLYGHLSELAVQPGQWVEQGTVIGRVGSTGNSTGPHLHFEWRQLTAEGWVASDPGTQLQYGLAQLLQSLQTAQAKPQSGGS